MPLAFIGLTSAVWSGASGTSPCSTSFAWLQRWTATRPISCRGSAPRGRPVRRLPSRARLLDAVRAGPRRVAASEPATCSMRPAVPDRREFSTAARRRRLGFALGEAEGKDGISHN